MMRGCFLEARCYIAEASRERHRMQCEHGSGLADLSYLGGSQ